MSSIHKTILTSKHKLLKMTGKIIYNTLKNQFLKVKEVDAKAILDLQFAWQDQFAQSIFKHEIKDGTITIPYEQMVVDWNEMWRERIFKRVIAEWENQTPILQFNSIGQYLLFYKSIFHVNGPLAIKIISKEYIQDIEGAYRNYPNENPEWKNIESFLYGTIHKVIQNK